jgi:MerR family transcriptional regulator, redox-sensitive transcriptional activator SoxR
MDGGTELTIGQAAQRSGVAPSTIRYYESIGLLPAPERESGQRRYDERILGRLAFIGVAQEAGFTLREIGELSAGVEDAADLAGPMRELSTRKLPEVQALIERAETMRSWLEVASGCTCSTPEECTLFPDGEDAPSGPVALKLVRVHGTSCRRSPTAGS